MSKNEIPLAPDLRPIRRRSKFLAIAATLALGMTMAPLLLEGTALCHSQWCELLGKPADVRTPILDAMQEQLEAARDEVSKSISPCFQHVPWNPKVVLPVAAVIMALGMSMLRL